jgi:23S rRNA pseudouridine2605 synthase
MPPRRPIPKGGPGSRRRHHGPDHPGRATGPSQRRRPAGSRRDAGPKTSAPAATGGGKPAALERLQKVLAHAGLGSRRSCEELILQGRVTVDGQVVRQLGTRVDAHASRIVVDGEPIKRETLVYHAVHKPKGYVSTNVDPSGRPRVVDLLPEIPERVYTVGRLDEDSTGLIILTNDGDLANRLAHPRYGVEKVYRALVAGLPDPTMLARLTEGVWLSDGKVRAKRARIAGRQGQATVLELVLAEGKKREIRRMLSKLGHKVMSLCRIAIGPISLKGLPAGESRPLTRHEIDLLRKVASGASVSLPRFSDPNSRSGRPRDSRRPRQAPTAGGPPSRAPRLPDRNRSNSSVSTDRPTGPPRVAPKTTDRPGRKPDRAENARPELPAKRRGPKGPNDAGRRPVAPSQPAHTAGASRIVIGVGPERNSGRGPRPMRPKKLKRKRPTARKPPGRAMINPKPESPGNAGEQNKNTGAS